MSTKVIVWRFLERTSKIYLIENNKVYYHIHGYLYESYIEVKEFDDQIEVDKVLNLLYWDTE